MNYVDSRKLRVLVNHTDPVLALGLAAALRQQPDFDVLMQGADTMSWRGAQADVVITDYGDGLALAADSVHAHAMPRVLVMTVFDREHDVRVALEAGVHGYLLLGCSVDELVTGVRSLGHRSRYLCLAVAQRMADSLTREVLTVREAEVLTWIASGQCNKSIASRLDITVGTVKTHVRAIMSKLDAGSRTEAANIATQRGLVDSPLRLSSAPHLTQHPVPATFYRSTTDSALVAHG